MGIEKEFSFGSCEFSRLSPDKIIPSTKKLNIIVGFGEALKLNLAIEECLRKLNRYKRSTREGKRAAINLTIHFDVERISVSEEKTREI
jgi:hypothetical protein